MAYTFEQLMNMDIFSRAEALAKMTTDEKITMIGTRQSQPSPKLVEAMSRTETNKISV